MDSKLILYIAASLDGYIADAKGGVDFLYETPSPSPDTAYEAFYDSVHALIMGGRTYRQIVETLAPDQWPYEGKPCYVYTSQSLGRAPSGVMRADMPPAELLQSIRRKHPGDVWLVGGGDIVRAFMQQNLIDVYCIYMMPVLLGEGVPLFPPRFPKTSLALESTSRIMDIVEIIYRRA